MATATMVGMMFMAFMRAIIIGFIAWCLETRANVNLIITMMYYLRRSHHWRRHEYDRREDDDEHAQALYDYGRIHEFYLSASV